MRCRNDPDAPTRKEPLTPLVSPRGRRWFTSAMAERRVSQRELARLMGVDPATIHRLLTGKRPMRLDEATDLARLLGKSVVDVLDNAGVPMRPTDTVPVAGFVDGIGEAHLELGGTERVPALAGAPGNTVALRAQTAGSPMQHLDGWVYYVELPLQPTIAEADVLGRYCLVELESGARLLRWVRRGYQRGTWNLDAPSSPAISNVTLVAATPVLGIRLV